MKKSLPKRLLAFLLIMAMITTTTEWTQVFTTRQNIYAAEETQTENKEKKEVIQSENTKNSTTFQLEDGKKETVFYGQDVRYETENGTLKEYDPTLTKIEDKKSENGNDLKDYAYENEEGDKKHYLPEKLTEKTPVLMENGKYEISFAPIYGQDSTAKEETGEEDTTSDSVEQAVAQANQAVRSISEDTSEEEQTDTDSEDALSSVNNLERTSLEEEKVEDAQGNVEKKPVKVSYESEKKDCTFSYESLNTGIKESIVLTKAPEGNVLKFHFKAKGLTPKKNTMDGGISFLDEKTEEIVATLEAPNMNDATGNAYSEKLSYDIEPDGEEDSYLLTLHLDEDYFQNKDRQYPVTIDPTVSWTGSANFWDVYVINGSYKDTNFYDSGVTVMMAGKAKQGVYRTYLRFKDFTKKIEGKYVDSATLTMYETGSSQSGQTIEARRVTENWSRPGLKWSNRPGYSTNYGSVKTTGKSKKARNINLTQYARECASGKITSYGVMLKNSDETKSYGQFFGSRASANRPKLSVTYYDGPTTATSASVTPKYVGKNDHSIKLSWAGINSKSLNRIEYRLATWVNNAEGNSNYVPYSSSTKIGTTSSGSANINSDKWAEGDYKIVVRGVDNGYINGYGKGVWFTVDRTAPTFASDPEMTSGKTSANPSSETSPVLKVTGKDANLSYIKYKVDNATSYTKGASFNGTTAQTTIKLPISQGVTDQSFKIQVVIVDKAGNESAAKTVNYYYIDDSKASDYAPEEGKVYNYYGKNVISWKKKEVPNSISYAIYRGKSADFTPSKENLVKSSIKGSYCMDTEVSDGTQWYYKVCAQKVTTKGEIHSTSEYITIKSPVQISNSEYTKWLGSKEYRDTAEITTPTGSGTIDKASGNLTYENTDFDINTGVMGLSLQRTYNSQSNKQGMFGNGWYDSFHKELYHSGDTVIFQDSDGSYLTFKKNGNTYTCEETKEYTLEEETKEQEKTYELEYMTKVKEEQETVEKTVSYQWTLTDKNQNVTRFDANGSMTAEEDSNGNFLLYDFDEKGLLSTVTTDKDQSLKIQYNDQNLVAAMELPDETKMKYTYDTAGNLTDASHVSKDETQAVHEPYSYDSAHRLTTIKDGKGNSYTVTYDREKATRFTKPDGEYQKITYGDGTTTVSLHKSDGTKLSQDSMTYDKNNGKLLSSTNESGIQTTYLYGDSRNELLQTGTQTKVYYQTLDNNKVSFLSDAKITTKTTYDENENVKEEVDETGQTTTTTYGTGKEENLPKREETQNSKGETVSNTTYGYDGAGNTTKEYEAVGDTLTEYDYDEDGEVEEERSYENVKTETDQGVLVSEQTTQKEEADHEVSETLTTTQGEVTEEDTTSYDAMGRETTSTDQNTGEVTKTTYDFMGRAIETVKTLDGNSQTEKKTYDANGTVTSETSSTGVVTKYTYDNRNRVITTEESADGVTKTTQTSYGYENASIHTLTGTKSYNNLSVQTTKVNGKITDKTFTDASGNAVRTFNAGIYTDHVFTEDGKEIASITLGSSTTGSGKITMTLYDKEGKTTHTINQPVISGTSVMVGKDTIVNQTAYDANGNESATTDGNGNTTKYTYDSQNRVTKVSKNNGAEDITNTVAYDIGTDGNTTTSVTDAKGHINKEVTNEAGLTESTTDLGDSNEEITTKYSYDSNGNKIKETYANGAYKTYDYDKKNRLIKTESYEAGEAGESIGEKTLKTTYSYDINDRILETVDYQVDGSVETAIRYTEYSYDSRGQMTGFAELSQETVPTAKEIAASQITYSYDNDGNIKKVTYPTTKNGICALSYVYDQNGWLTQIKGDVRSGSSKTEKTVRSYTYDAYGKVKEIKDYRNLLKSTAQAVKKVYTYDSFDRVKEMKYTDLVTGKEMESYSYSYDKNSNIIQKTEINNYPAEDAKKVNETKTYTYDGLGHLTKTVTTNHKKNDQKKTVTYTYDKAGNRTKEDDGTTQTAYTYNGLDQLKTATKAKGTAVDEVRQYSYDANGNQTEIKNTKTGQTESYAYDAENRLSQVSVTSKDGKTSVIQQNRYNGDGQRIQKVEGSKTTNYYYQDGVVSYTTDAAGSQTSQNLIGTDGNIIVTQRYASDNTSYYLYNKDIQGSSTSLVKEDGSADSTYQYTDFGETTINGDDKAGNEVCYTGGIYDQSTGLYYLNARYYNPKDGRFLTEDSYRGEKDRPDTQHLYIYCANNPVNYVDPSGHKKKLIGAGIQVSASASVSFLDVGVGIEIVYFFKQIKGVYAYWYREIGTSFSAAKNGAKKLYSLIKKQPGKIFSKPSFSCAICAFAVFSNKKNKTAKAYRGIFKTKGVGALGYKGFISTGGGFRTVGAGKSFGNSGLSVSSSYYYLMGDVGKIFSKYVNKIKSKAKRFFKK